MSSGADGRVRGVGDAVITDATRLGDAPSICEPVIPPGPLPRSNSLQVFTATSNTGPANVMPSNRQGGAAGGAHDLEALAAGVLARYAAVAPSRARALCRAAQPAGRRSGSRR